MSATRKILAAAASAGLSFGLVSCGTATTTTSTTSASPSCSAAAATGDTATGDTATASTVTRSQFLQVRKGQNVRDVHRIFGMNGHRVAYTTLGRETAETQTRVYRAQSTQCDGPRSRALYTVKYVKSPTTGQWVVVGKSLPGQPAPAGPRDYSSFTGFNDAPQGVHGRAEHGSGAAEPSAADNQSGRP
jgi:hypothetical protein